MSNETEINWGYNCLTQGVHHGRQEKLWKLPLAYALHIYGREMLKEMVVARIYNDAIQYVEHGLEPRPSQEWAEKVKQFADENFEAYLDRKIQELTDFYTSSQHRHDVEGVVDRIKRNKLNPGYEPLHLHDTINMNCRILGTAGARNAARS